MQEIVETKRRLAELYVKHTGQPYQLVEQTLERDHFFTPSQAKEFGILDAVLKHPIKPTDSNQFTPVSMPNEKSVFPEVIDKK